jgi:hypothetical protein
MWLGTRGLSVIAMGGAVRMEWLPVQEGSRTYEQSGSHRGPVWRVKLCKNPR